MGNVLAHGMLGNYQHTAKLPWVPQFKSSIQVHFADKNSLTVKYIYISLPQYALAKIQNKSQV